MKKLFRDTQQARLFGLLSLSTLFCFALLWGRLQYIDFDWSKIQSIRDLAFYRGSPTFIFLVWNLFLAWIPYWIALSVRRVYNFTASKIIIIFLLIAWLLFFPNAPYIITDLLHLRKYDTIPHWYDLMLFVTFAWTGLMLGYQSLYEIQLFLEDRVSRIFSWVFALICIPLAGLGIFIGRFQRWNTWDVVAQPYELGHELLTMFLNPSIYGHRLGLALVISVFMLLGYLMMLAMVRK